MTETPEQWRERKRDAERAHDRHGQHLMWLNESILTFATATVRSVSLAAAGGIAAALGFFSANYNRLSESPAAVSEFNAILLWLFVSLLLSICIPGAAYFAQTGYANSSAETHDTWHHPFNKRTWAGFWWSVLARFFHTTSVLFTIGAIMAIAWGGYRFLALVQMLR